MHTITFDASLTQFRYDALQVSIRWIQDRKAPHWTYKSPELDRPHKLRSDVQRVERTAPQSDTPPARGESWARWRAMLRASRAQGALCS